MQAAPVTEQFELVLEDLLEAKEIEHGSAAERSIMENPSIAYRRAIEMMMMHPEEPASFPERAKTFMHLFGVCGILSDDGVTL